MIYTAEIDGKSILDPSNDITLGSPVLELADNTAGSFSFDIYRDNPLYETIADRGQQVITVKRDTDVLWKGRILSTETGFDGTISVTAEGELGYLDDTIQRPAEYHNETVRSFLVKLINAHNAKAGADKQFTVGSVTVTDSNNSLYRYTNWESTLAAIKDKLLDRLGGHLRIRYVGSTRYLDYLADSPKTADQSIDFGENLMDYVETRDGTEIATVCIPLGAQLEEKSAGYPEALEERLTIESVNSGSDEIALGEAVSKYGRITRTVTFDDVHTAQILMDKGEEWLTNNQFETVKLEVTAVDLAGFGLAETPFDLLDRIHCYSSIHGLNRTFPLLQMTIHPLEPESDTFTLGNVEKTFTASIANAQKALADEIGKIDTSGVLTQALQNAQNMMNSLGKNGHVVLRSSEILIMDTEDIDTAVNIWRWNQAGFAHSSSGYEGPYDVAITMDGHIAGSVISAGTLEADALSVSAKSTLEKYTDDALKSYYTAIQTDAKIEAAANSITLSVTDSLKVNDNLLTNTRNPQNSDGLHTALGTAPMFVPAFQENCFTSEIESGSYYGSYIYTSDVRMEPSTAYTFSFDSYCFSSLSVYVVFSYRASSTETAYKTTSRKISLDPSSVQRKSWSFVSPSSIYDGFFRIYGYASATGTYSRYVYLNSLKLEKGSKATAWDLNRADVVSRAALTILSDSIESKVSKGEFGTVLRQSATDLRIAWNGLSNYVSIESAGLSIYNSSAKTEKSRIFRLDESGMVLTRSGARIGNIGTNEFKGDSTKRGLTFDLESSGSYMAWGAQYMPSEPTYTVQLLYANERFSDYVAKHLYISAPTHFTDKVTFDNHTYGKAGDGNRYCGREISDTLYLPTSKPAGCDAYTCRIVSGLVVETTPSSEMD